VLGSKYCVFGLFEGEGGVGEGDRLLHRILSNVLAQEFPKKILTTTINFRRV